MFQTPHSCWMICRSRHQCLNVLQIEVRPCRQSIFCLQKRPKPHQWAGGVKMAASYYRGSCVRLNSSECNALPKRGAQDIVSTLHAVNEHPPTRQRFQYEEWGAEERYVTAVAGGSRCSCVWSVVKLLIPKLRSVCLGGSLNCWYSCISLISHQNEPCSLLLVHK